MTRTGPTDAVMPTCTRIADGPVSALIAFRAPGSVWCTPREPTSARPVFPRVALVNHACGRFAGRPGRFWSAGQGSRCPRVSEQKFLGSPTHRIYLCLLKLANQLVKGETLKVFCFVPPNSISSA